MKIIYIQKNRQPRVVNVEHSLDEMQRLVGGMIEIVEPFDDPVVLVCDDNGRIDGKPVNRVINDKMDVCGDFFLCGHDGCDLSDVPEDYVDKYVRLFSIQSSAS